MMWPLYILAIPSLLFGILVGPTHLFERFLEPAVWSFEHSENVGVLKEGAPILSGEMVGYVISSIIAIGGLMFARWVYTTHKTTGSWFPESTKEKWLKSPFTPAGFLYDTFVAKWGFDAAYEFVFLKCGGWFATNVLWKFIDKGLIDGIVNGIAGLVGVFSKGTRRLQTGYVRNYALAMLLGVVLVVGGLLYTYNKMIIR